MSRTNRKFMLRRAYEHFVSSLGALAATSLLLVSVNAQATAPKNTLKPSVTILVPTVTIEAVE